MRADIVERTAEVLLWDFIEGAERADRRARDTTTEMDRLAAQVESLEARLTELRLPEVKALLSVREWATEVGAVERELEGTAAALGHAMAASPEAPRELAVIQEQWPTMSVLDRRAVFGEFFDVIAVDPDGAIVGYEKGAGPMDDLPRRGYPQRDVRPFPSPANVA